MPVTGISYTRPLLRIICGQAALLAAAVAVIVWLPHALLQHPFAVLSGLDANALAGIVKESMQQCRDGEGLTVSCLPAAAALLITYGLAEVLVSIMWISGLALFALLHNRHDSPVDPGSGT